MSASLVLSARLKTLAKLSQNTKWLLPSPVSIIPNRTAKGKHYDPKWRRHRARKFIKIDLADWQKIKRESNLEPDEMRADLKKKGMLPPRTFEEKQLLISSTAGLFEEYVPPEGDGLASMISGEGAKQRLTEIEKKGKSYLQLRKIKSFQENFDIKKFSEEALDIYKSANTLLQKFPKDIESLHDVITESAFPKMTVGLENKTLVWSYEGAIEPSRVVHIRTTNMVSKDNIYAQVTVRFHTQQKLAIYDRFGRLMFGSEHLIKDCLEYICFENHLSDDYGRWRLHAKIVPEWNISIEHMPKTMRIPEYAV